MENKKPEETRVKDLPTKVDVPDDGAVKGGTPPPKKSKAFEELERNIGGESTNDVHNSYIEV